MFLRACVSFFDLRLRAVKSNNLTPKVVILVQIRYFCPNSLIVLTTYPVRPNHLFLIPFLISSLLDLHSIFCNQTGSTNRLVQFLRITIGAEGLGFQERIQEGAAGAAPSRRKFTETFVV